MELVLSVNNVTNKIYRAPKGTVLHLSRSPELTSVPLSLTLTDPLGASSRVVQDFSFFQQGIQLERAGPYQISFTDPFNHSEVEVTVLVEPVLQCGTDTVTVDEVVLQSHLTKCMGPVERWRDVLNVSVQSGYNMVHLTPIQQLGVSNSSYSLHSHLSVSDSIGLQSTGYRDRLAELETHLTQLKADTGLVFMVDIVWNHVSLCNPEIKQHPHSYYNLYNTPNLLPAHRIDVCLARVSSSLTNTDISNNEHLAMVRDRLWQVLEKEEGYLAAIFSVNVEDAVQEFKKTIEHTNCTGDGRVMTLREGWSRDKLCRDHCSTIDVDHLIAIFSKGSVEQRCGEVRQALIVFNNNEVIKMVKSLLEHIVLAVLGAVRYRFIQSDGLQYERVSEDHPLVERYFQVSDLTLVEEHTLDMSIQYNGERVMCCNGWTMGDSIDSMETTNAYLYRDVVIWADCLKLRYGDCPADSPWLWGYMDQYTSDMARLFEGFRLDNCHNTPLHVGQHLLQTARTIRPDLYIVAELFTNDEALDCKIINQLGINSCIRELHQASNAKSLCDLVYHYGESRPCGSFTQLSAKGRPILRPCRPHALLMDQSHDNPCPFDDYPVPNTLAVSTVMLASRCGTGSNRGYDELVPHHVHVVNESRLYSTVHSTGLCEAKSELSKLHRMLERQGYSETFVDQKTAEVIIITRHDPVTCNKVLYVVGTMYSTQRYTTQIHIEDRIVEVMLELTLSDSRGLYERSEEYITGIDNVVTVRKSIAVPSDSILTVTPGTVIVLRIEQSESVREGLHHFHHIQMPTLEMSTLSLVDLNYILYRCGEEERVEGRGGVYNVPGYGDLAYAGIQGFLSVLDTISADNNTGHPLCQNLYQGLWMLAYITDRLKLRDSTRSLGTALEVLLAPFSTLPNYTRPKVLHSVLCTLYSVCMSRVGKLIFIYRIGSHEFTKSLVLTSIQLVSDLKGVGVKPHPNSPQPISLAAGLPHFSHGFMRCWGRDTFIALPGLLLVTGRVEEARDLIVGFARTYRHGLIPNLLSEAGHCPRYNCRDAIWWWCRAVQLLWIHMPGIVNERVHLIFSEDNSDADMNNQESCTVLDIVHSTLQRHVTGILFTERNAGPGLDEHLKYEGFTIQAGIDQQTGFVYGGSEHNCGTWMDKVGSSSGAGNKGLPATPRYGSAVELVALCYQAVRWCSELSEGGITFTDGEYLTYSAWCERMRAHFEQQYWVPTIGYYRDCVNDREPELRPNQCVAMMVAPELFNQTNRVTALRTMGRKLAGPLGMCTLSPDDPHYSPYYENSDQSEEYTTAHGFNYHQGPEWVWCMSFFLRAQLATLSGNADHQLSDPPASYFTSDRERGVLGSLLYSFGLVTAPHKKMIAQSHYRGLTELTNKGGALCTGSCPTQAWSSGCMLELLGDLGRLYD